MYSITALLVVLGAGLVFGACCLSAWILMLLLGALASLTGVAGLALGFWACLVLNIICAFLFKK